MQRIARDRIMIMRWAAALTVATVAIAISLVPTAHAHIIGEPDPELPDFEYHIPDIQVEVHGQLIDASQLVTYQAMADEDDVTVAEIIDRYHWQSDFARVVTELADTYPDQFAGAAITNQSSEGWVAFSGEPPAAALTLVGSLPKAVQIIGDRGFSEEELPRRLEEVYYSVLDHPQVFERARHDRPGYRSHDCHGTASDLRNLSEPYVR